MDGGSQTPAPRGCRSSRRLEHGAAELEVLRAAPLRTPALQCARAEPPAPGDLRLCQVIFRQSSLLASWVGAKAAAGRPEASSPMGEADGDFIRSSGSTAYVAGEARASRLPPICLPCASRLPPPCLQGDRCLRRGAQQKARRIGGLGTRTAGGERDGSQAASARPLGNRRR
jgi:hypothetical protein